MAISLSDKFNPVNQLLTELVQQRRQATDEQLTQIITHVATAPFVEAVLAVDELLWGGFWQFDVIAPGYQLPAVELALLRAIRLDQTWPEGTTVEQFLAELRTAMRDPQAGVWTLPVGGEPCLVIAGTGRQEGAGEQGSRGAENFVTRHSSFVTPHASRSLAKPPYGTHHAPHITHHASLLVWYCATTGRLHAGYRAKHVNWTGIDGVVMQRGPTAAGDLTTPVQSEQSWLVQVVEAKAQTDLPDLAARLDLEILRLRTVIT